MALTPYELPSGVVAEILDLAAQSEVLLVGETHGTQEVPGVVSGLLERLRPLGYRGLGLEVPWDQRGMLALWAGGNRPAPPPFFAQPSPDGRGNVQALALAKQALGSGWEVLCFDQGPGQTGPAWRDRDAWMAENLVTQLERFCPDAKVVVVCGNLHSRLVRPDWAVEDEMWPSLAAGLAARGFCVNSVAVVFHGGAYFNMEEKRFVPDPLPMAGPAEVRPSGWRGHRLELHLPRATPATFFRPPRIHWQPESR